MTLRHLLAAVLAVLITALSVLPQHTARLPSSTSQAPRVDRVTIQGNGSIADTSSMPIASQSAGTPLWPAAASEADRKNVQSYGPITSGTTLASRISAATADLVANGGVLYFPSGTLSAYSPTYALPPANVLWEIDGPNINRGKLGFGSAVTDSLKVFHGFLGTARPSNNNRAGVADMFWAEGSGQNGAQNADFAHSFHLYKQNWNCTTARQAAGQCTTVANQGEIDTLYLTAFNGGPDATNDPALKSATALMTGGPTCVSGIGFCAHSEFVTQIVDPLTFGVQQAIDLQQGVINSRPAEAGSWGTVYIAQVGTQTSGLRFQNDTGSRWSNILDNLVDGFLNFRITDTGTITWRTSGAATTTLSGAGGVLATNAPIGSAAPAWTAGEALVFGDVRSYGSAWYRVINVGGTTATGSEPAAVGTGTSTGADGIQWTYGGAGSNAASLQTASGKLRADTLLSLNSAQGAPVSLPVAALPGSPDGVVTSPAGGFALRTGGGVGRTAYVKETGVGATGWNPVVTAFQTVGIVATGTTQATATALAARINVVATAAAGSGVALQSAFRDEQIIINRGGNALNVYPPSGGTIDAGAVNAPLTTAASGKGAVACVSSVVCYTTQ